MSRIARTAWTLAAVVTIELARLFPGVGRVRARVPRDHVPPGTDLDRTLRGFRRAVVALWAVNVLVAASLVATLAGVIA